MDAHPFVDIIPEIKQGTDDHHSKTLDLTQSRSALFSDYFELKYGQKPSDDLCDLLKEVMAENEDEQHDSN